MRKITFFLVLMVAMVTTAWAQFDTTKQYRIKSVTIGNYLTIGTASDNAYGHVYGADKDDNNQEQIFTFIDAGSSKYYVMSATGKYFSENGKGKGWNLNYATSQSEALALTFVDAGNGQYRIQSYNSTKSQNLYFKYEYVTSYESNSTGINLYHPFTDVQSSSNAELWVVEEFVSVVAPAANTS